MDLLECLGEMDNYVGRFEWMDGQMRWKNGYVYVGE